MEDPTKVFGLRQGRMPLLGRTEPKLNPKLVRSTYIYRFHSSPINPYFIPSHCVATGQSCNTSDDCMQNPADTESVEREGIGTTGVRRNGDPRSPLACGNPKNGFIVTRIAELRADAHYVLQKIKEKLQAPTRFQPGFASGSLDFYVQQG